MAVSLAVCEIWSVKEWRDNKNWVRSCSRSLNMPPFDRPYTTLNSIGRPLKLYLYLVPYSSYLALNNIMILKYGLEATQGHWKWCHLKAWVRFPIILFSFYSNYVAILYRLRDIASYWSKIAKFLYPPVFSASKWGDPIGISRKCLILIKLEWLRYCAVKKLWQYVKPFP